MSSLAIHTPINPLHTLTPHPINPPILPMIINFHPQFRTFHPVLVIKCSRLHCNLLPIITSSRREWRPAISTELTQYHPAPVTTTRVQLGRALDVLETRLWHDNVGGEA